MPHDFTGEWELTDQGESILQSYNEGGLDQVMLGELPGSSHPSMQVAHFAAYSFLRGLAAGQSAKELYTRITKGQPTKIVRVVDKVIDTIIRTHLIEKVEVSDLPSAFKKDFGQYE